MAPRPAVDPRARRLPGGAVRARTGRRAAGVGRRGRGPALHAGDTGRCRGDRRDARAEGDRRRGRGHRRDRPRGRASARDRGAERGRAAGRDDRRPRVRADPRGVAADERGGGDAARGALEWLGVHGDASGATFMAPRWARRLRAHRPRGRATGRGLWDGGAPPHPDSDRRAGVAGRSRCAARRQRHRQPARAAERFDAKADRRAADRSDRARQGCS